jgi:hypothetical protein
LCPSEQTMRHSSVYVRQDSPRWVATCSRQSYTKARALTLARLSKRLARLDNARPCIADLGYVFVCSDVSNGSVTDGHGFDLSDAGCTRALSFVAVSICVGRGITAAGTAPAQLSASVVVLKRIKIAPTVYLSGQSWVLLTTGLIGSKKDQCSFFATLSHNRIC